MPVIDVHTHLARKSEIPDVRDRHMLEVAGFPVGSAHPVEQLLEEMDRGGIDKSVVLGTPHVAERPFDNAALAEAIEPYHDRLIGFGALDPRNVEDMAGGVRYCVEELGFKGIGEVVGIDIASPDCFPMYEACIELGVPILIHMGFSLPTVPLKYCHPMLLDDVVIRYPELKVIAAHCAAPWFNELAGVAFRHENVWVDVSALGMYPAPMRYQAIGTMIGSGLGGRLLFGSDFPVVRPSEWLKWVRSFKVPLPLRALLGLPAFTAADREAMFYGNAAKLLAI